MFEQDIAELNNLVEALRQHAITDAGRLRLAYLVGQLVQHTLVLDQQRSDLVRALETAVRGSRAVQAELDDLRSKVRAMAYSPSLFA